MNAIDVGDRGVAVLVTAADPAARCAEVRGLAAGLAAAGIGGVTDVVPSPGRVTVVYDPLQIGHAAVRDRIGRIVTATRDSPPPAPEMRHELPVCYGGEHGPDLAEVCLRHGIDERTFVALHTGPDYTVEAIGFLPGFGYLAGLPERLATPRRATPRRVVPAGSVGIGGRHTAAYPAASPGGWNLVGATPTPLFDASRPRPATLGAGDRVRFTAIDAGQFARLRREVDAGPAWSSGGGITVLTPGLATTIQDLGRPGHRAEGVPLSGAADTVSLRLANRLVGNPATAAGLEITLLGPTLRFDRSALVAVAGAEFPGVPHGRAVRVAAGDTIAFGHATSGCRGYLAVAGGIDVPQVLGSRSTCVAARLGGIRGLPLAAGDALPVGEAGLGRIATPAAGRIAIDEAAATGVTLRVIAGEQWALVGDRLWSTTHVATSRSDRMGVRLDGPPLATEPVRGDLPSVAVLPGAIQLPPDGAPIILLADAQTIGGYPVIGHVIAADLPLVAQLRPGAAVRWRHATIAEAHAALTQLEARLLGGEA